MGKKFLGFHGTTRESADQIIKTGYFNISDDDEEWLGEGIYFFEDDAKQACYYCVKAKRFKSWAVL